MKIDQRFYCFGCGATGDVNDFVAGVFGIGKRDAPKKTVKTWRPFFCEALQRISYVEYLLDILLFDETEDRVAVIVCYERRVMKLEKRIGELEAGNNGSFEMDNGGYGTREECGRNKAGLISGWVAYKNPKRYKKHGSQKGWERVDRNKLGDSDFLQLTEKKAEQMKLPFLESSG